MSKIFVFIFMIFCHIIDDFVLQAPCLSNLKQKSWWEKNALDNLYRNDYKVALIMHSLSWSFMILLPIVIYRDFNVNGCFILILLANAAIHGIIDDLKANLHKINLVTDQSIHLLQIIAAFAGFCNGEI